MGKITRINQGRRVMSEEEARARNAIVVPNNGILPPGVRKYSKEEALAKLPSEMVSRVSRRCTECFVLFEETIIHAPDEPPKARPMIERPDLCANCFGKLSRAAPLLSLLPRRETPESI